MDVDEKKKTVEMEMVMVGIQLSISIRHSPSLRKEKGRVDALSFSLPTVSIPLSL